jgi:hypothetical protein
MVGERLYVVQFVVAVEDHWFGPETDGSPTRIERRHYIEAQLFAAADAESAYRVACEWLPGFTDANHDGSGNLTRKFAVGIHQVDELELPAPSNLPAAVRRLYGVDVGRYDPGEVDPGGTPLVRAKTELAIFQRTKRLGGRA